jgi:imidazolonepropionase-like amidohydrolase
MLTFFLLTVCSQAPAQDLIVDNARIVVGNGRVIDHGNIVIHNGRIGAVNSGSASDSTFARLDAGGRTVMPGLINTHWHLTVGAPSTSDEELDAFVADVVATELRDLLERGVTTIMTAGDHYPAILGIREKTRSGELRSPRLLVVGPVLTSPDDWPTQICAGNDYCRDRLNRELVTTSGARATVRTLAAAGVDAIKLVYDDRIAPGVRIDDELVAAIAAEADASGLTLFVHVSTAEETGLRVAELGAGRLVHPVPLRTAASAHGAERLREMGIAVSTTVSGMSPEWSEAIGREHDEELARQFSDRLEDLRRLKDAGVVVAFGTDTVAGPGSQADRQFLAEALSLNRIMSNAEVIRTLTGDAAIYLELEDELGTLESGKLADVIVIDGDPLADLSDLMKVDVVIQGGRIVSDRS